jgi:MFS family permease
VIANDDVIANDEPLTAVARWPVASRAHRSQAFQLLLLFFVVLAEVVAWIAVGAVQETMRVSLAMSDSHMALLQGPALALPLALGGVLLGRVIDRTSRARLLLVFTLVNLAGSLLTAYATGFAVLFAARCLVGTMGSGIDMAVLSLLSDLFPPAQRGRAGMVCALAQFGGNSAAFALGGVLVAANTGPNAWRWAIFGLSLPSAVSLLLLTLVREPPRAEVAVANPSSSQALGELWRYRGQLAPVCGGAVLMQVAYHAVRVWAAPTLQRSFALSPDRVGGIMSLVMLLGGVLGTVAGGSLADFCQRSGGPARTLSALSWLVFLSGAAALFALMPGAGLASALLFVFVAIIGAEWVMTLALITVVAPNEIRGLCMGISGAANCLFGIVIAPVAVSALSNTLGGPTMIGTALAIVAVPSCVLAALMFFSGRRPFLHYSNS